MNDKQTSRATELDNVLASQVGDLAETGYSTPVEPDTAEMMGAFEEDALDSEEAIESRFDHEARGGDDE